MKKDFYDKENLNGRETIFEPFGDGGRSRVIVKDLPGWGTNHRCETCGEVRNAKILAFPGVTSSADCIFEILITV